MNWLRHIRDRVSILIVMPGFKQLREQTIADNVAFDHCNSHTDIDAQKWVHIEALV